MKPVFTICAFTLYAGLIFSFAQKNDDKHQPIKVLVDNKAAKNISLRFFGKIIFRSSYASIQFMNDEEEINKYLRKQEKSNPSFEYAENEILKKRLAELGYIKDNRFLLNKFKYNTKTELQFTDSAQRNFRVRFGNAEHEEVQNHLTVSVGSDSSTITIGAVQELKYALLDIIPGGSKEIIILNKYYIMNGDNFELTVYEII